MGGQVLFHETIRLSVTSAEIRFRGMGRELRPPAPVQAAEVEQPPAEAVQKRGKGIDKEDSEAGPLFKLTDMTQRHDQSAGRRTVYNPRQPVPGSGDSVGEQVDTAEQQIASTQFQHHAVIPLA